MKAIKQLTLGVAVIAATCIVSTSARASFVIEQQGPVLVDDSWTVGWAVSGGPLDTIVGTVLAGKDTFESWGTTLFTPGSWTINTVTAYSGSISGPAATFTILSPLGFSTTFTDLPSDQPPVLINFQAFDAGTLVGSETLLWNGSEFDVVPEPTTMIAGALLLLPFGASTLRILRRNCIA